MGKNIGKMTGAQHLPASFCVCVSVEDIDLRNLWNISQYQI